MLTFEKCPRRYAVAATVAALLCAILAFAACATNPADDAATQAAIADAVAATVAAQRPTLAAPPDAPLHRNGNADPSVLSNVPTDITAQQTPEMPSKAGAAAAGIMAGEVRQVRFTMGDLVERIRVLQGINRYEGGQVDFSRVPFEMLMNLVRAEILRQAAPGLQIEITEADIDEALRERFRPEANPGEEPDEGQLDAEFDNAYANFLEQVNLTDGGYRRIVEEQLQRQELFAYMLAAVPDEAPQVEVQAINMSVNSDADPAAVKERINLGEEFSSVALEVSGSDGYIGWMPEGVVPEFDRYLFGDTECLALQEAGGDDAPAECEGPLLEPGETSDPIYVNEIIVLLQPIGPAETREVESQMQIQLAGAEVEQWHEDQVAKGSDEGWVKINFNSERYAWVTEQVQQTRPRVTLTPQP